jgi:DNA replication and repair protein RecF
MIIKKLKLVNFRNHEESRVEFSPGLNVIHGMNGEGKTSVLEAIYVLSMTRSFLPVQDSGLVRHDSPAFFLSGEMSNDLDMNYKISINYEPGKRKKINSTFGENLTPRDVIGEMPVVMLSPDYKNITFGAPSDRRQFMDSLLSQSSKAYLALLYNHKKSLKQRNILLAGYAREKRIDRNQFESWTEVFVKKSAEIIVRREKFIRDFSPYFNKYYQTVSGGKEAVEINYLPDSLPADVFNGEFESDSIKSILSRHAFENRERELARGTTVFGPQKDDIEIRVNGGTAKDTASQGQHKSLLVSIKFAEFKFLSEIRKETPVILLDDIFSELDRKRSEFVLEMIKQNQAQTFITVTEPELLNSEKKEFVLYEVQKGKISRV